MDGQSATDGMRRAANAAGLNSAETERTLQSAWETAEPRGPVDPAAKGFNTLDIEALRQLPKPKWLLEGVLPEGLSLLLGRYASLKSWTALDWAAAASEQGKRVLYFVGEDVHGFGQRVIDLADARGLDLGNLKIVDDTPKLLRPGVVEKLQRTIKDWNTDLIVLDTWATCIPGVGENDFPELSRATEILMGLMKTQRCSSLVVAHTGFQDQRMRGHTSVEDRSDCIWHTKTDDTIVGAATIENRKVKNSPKLHTLEVSLRKINERTVLDPSVLDD